MKEEISAGAAFICKLLYYWSAVQSRTGAKEHVSSRNCSESSSNRSSSPTTARLTNSSTPNGQPSEPSEGSNGTTYTSSNGMPPLSESSSSSNQSALSPDLERLRESLTDLLGERFAGHWPAPSDHSLSGQAFRCISVSATAPIDPVLLEAAKRALFSVDSLRFPADFQLWIDPGDVCCRFGEARGHAVQVASRSKDGSGRVDSFVDTIDMSELMRTVEEQRENEYTTMALRYSGVRINPMRYSSSRPATNGYSAPSSNGGGHYSANGYMNGNSHAAVSMAAAAMAQQQMLAYSLAQANGYHQSAALYSQQNASGQPNLNELIYASYGEDGATQNGAQVAPSVWFPPVTSASHGTPYHIQQQQQQQPRQWRQLGSSPTPVLTPASGGRRGTPVNIQAPSGATMSISSGPRPPSGYLNGVRLHGRESPSQSPLKFMNGATNGYLIDPTASALG